MASAKLCSRGRISRKRQTEVLLRIRSGIGDLDESTRRHSVCGDRGPEDWRKQAGRSFYDVIEVGHSVSMKLDVGRSGGVQD